MANEDRKRPTPSREHSTVDSPLTSIQAGYITSVLLSVLASKCWWLEFRLTESSVHLYFPREGDGLCGAGLQRTQEVWSGDGSRGEGKSLGLNLYWDFCRQGEAQTHRFGIGSHEEF